MSLMKAFSITVCLCTLSSIAQGFSNPFQGFEKCFHVPQTCTPDLDRCPCGGKWFDPPMRPMCCRPFDVKDFRLEFRLYTRSNKENYCLVEPNKDSLDQCLICDIPRLIIFIHGFGTDMTGDDKELYDRFKNVMLEATDVGVILLKWSPLNGVEYPQAVANARIVGVLLAKFIEVLQKHNCVHAKNIHLIGHSLGCHIAGFAGKEVKRLLDGYKVGRITGCDCAGPFFQSKKGTLKECSGHLMKSMMHHSRTDMFEKGMEDLRLNSSDAMFVDCIHTNDGCTPLDGFGCKEQLGHVDIYPNGGSVQPGCDKERVQMDVNVVKPDGSKKIDQLGSKGCNHFRCLVYIIESIQNENAFSSTQCENYEKYTKGDCNAGPKINMGMHAKLESKNLEGQRWYCNISPESPHSF